MSRSCERLLLISGRFVFSTSEIAFGVVGCASSLTKFTISWSACAIDAASRFRKRWRIVSKSGPSQWTSGVGKLENQSLETRLIVRCALSESPAMPWRKPSGFIVRSAPKPPFSVPVKKPVFGESAVPPASVETQRKCPFRRAAPRTPRSIFF